MLLLVPLLHELRICVLLFLYPLCYVVVRAPYYTTHSLFTLVRCHLSLERSHCIQTHIFVTYFNCSLSTVNIVACSYPYVCPLMCLFSLPLYSFRYTSFEQNATRGHLISVVLQFLTSIIRIGIFMWCRCKVNLLKAYVKQHDSHTKFAFIFWLRADKNESLGKESVVWQ